MRNCNINWKYFIVFFLLLNLIYSFPLSEPSKDNEVAISGKNNNSTIAEESINKTNTNTIPDEEENKNTSKEGNVSKTEEETIIDNNGSNNSTIVNDNSNNQPKNEKSTKEKSKSNKYAFQKPITNSSSNKDKQKSKDKSNNSNSERKNKESKNKNSSINNDKSIVDNGEKGKTTTPVVELNKSDSTNNSNGTEKLNTITPNNNNNNPDNSSNTKEIHKEKSSSKTKKALYASGIVMGMVVIFGVGNFVVKMKNQFDEEFNTPPETKSVCSIDTNEFGDEMEEIDSELYIENDKRFMIHNSNNKNSISKNFEMKNQIISKPSNISSLKSISEFSLNDIDTPSSRSSFLFSYNK